MEHFRINENIRLETLKMSMAAPIFQSIANNREFLGKWLPFVEHTHKLSDTEKFIKSVLHQPEKRRDIVYSIWYKEEFAGLIGFKETDWINKKTELGYWLTEKMQGKGIVSLCVKTLMNFAFTKLKLNRIQIKTACGNTKSASIPKKLGFIFEGIEREGELHRDRFFDLEVYSLVKSDLRTL